MVHTCLAKLSSFFISAFHASSPWCHNSRIDLNLPFDSWMIYSFNRKYLINPQTLIFYFHVPRLSPISSLNVRLHYGLEYICNFENRICRKSVRWIEWARFASSRSVKKCWMVTEINDKSFSETDIRSQGGLEGYISNKMCVEKKVEWLLLM